MTKLILLKFHQSPFTSGTAYLGFAAYCYICLPRLLWNLYCFNDTAIVYCFMKSSTQTFTLGASVTLSDMIELFTKEAAKSGNVGSFNELKKYLYRVASSPIRNVSVL